MPTITGVSGRMLRGIFGHETIDGTSVSTAMKFIVDHAACAPDGHEWAAAVMQQFVDPRSAKSLLDHAKPRRAFIAALKAEIAYHAPARRVYSDAEAAQAGATRKKENRGISANLNLVLEKLYERYPEEKA